MKLLFWVSVSVAILPSFCQITTLHVVEGKPVTLTPVGAASPITSVLWKVGDHKVAEFDPGFEDTYRSYKGRTTFDKNTGSITIKAVSASDEGDYSVEVNHVLLPGKFALKVYEEIGPVSITGTLDQGKRICVLNCSATPSKLSYLWSPGDVEGEVLEVPEADWEKAFTCKASRPNPVDFNSAQVIPQDKCVSHRPLTATITGGVLGAIAIVGILVTLGYLYKNGDLANLPYMRANRSGDSETGTNGAAGSPGAGNGGTAVSTSNNV